MAIVKLEDGLALGFCTRGQMRFFRQHGLDFADFSRNGIPVERLAGIDDANMAKVVAKVQEREEGVSGGR